jgi:3-hydroxyacyl-[acyl-carrier-protein] dehydratase
MAVNTFADMISTEEILLRLPYSKPFLFVDSIAEIDDESVTGSFTLHKDLDFYKGHFIQHPVTPGVILVEIMAQIGLVCLGIQLMQKEALVNDFPFVLSSANVEFLKPVYPDETVIVTSRKKYFRFGKLKCETQMYNAKNELVCEGTLAGIIIQQQHD